MTSFFQHPWLAWIRRPRSPAVDSVEVAGVPVPTVVVTRDADLAHTLESALPTVAQPLCSCRNLWVARRSARGLSARLILVDWRLPAPALTQIVRHFGRSMLDPVHRPVVVALVPRGDDQLAAAAAGAAVDDWIVLPESESVLTARVARVIAVAAGGPRRADPGEGSMLAPEAPSTLDRVDDGLFCWDLERNRFEPGESFAAMIGADEASDRSLEAWLEQVHPEDAPRLRHALESCRTDGPSPVLQRFRLRHRDGGHRWMLLRAEVVRTADSGPTHVLGRQIELSPLEGSIGDGSLLALYDPLTGVPNRALLIDRIRHVMATVRRNPARPFAVLFFDVDRFKNVNDSLGHLKGDSLLRSVAERVSAACRPSDTVARFGGDEFAVVVEDAPDVRAAIVAAERLQAQFAKPFDLDGIDVFVSISIGIAFWRDDYRQAEELLRDADTAMYRAKAMGRNTFAVFDEDMHARVVATLKLENDLRRALTREEFRPYFQPIFSLRHGRITGFEVLARWEHPERGLLLPKEFIPVAEEMGAIIQIDRLIAEHACIQLRSWQNRFRFAPPLWVSVNISTTQFLLPDLVPQIDHILRKTGLYGQSLKLEVTESALMEHARYATDMLAQLRALDIGIMIDDFGTGYSSLAYLRRFEVDTLKIDYSFVSRMTEDDESEEIVRTIVTLARNLGKETVAEGVESRKQLELLRELKVDRVQGFYLAPPLSPPDAEELLESIRTAPDHLERILTCRLRNQREENGRHTSTGETGPLSS